MSHLDKKLTSVEVQLDLFENFKEKGSKDKISFRKLVERSLFLYLTDNEYREQILRQRNTVLHS